MKQSTHDSHVEQLKDKKVLPPMENENNVSTTNGHLVSRSNLISISATQGKWSRAKHKKMFASGVDEDFENYHAVGNADQPTEAVRGILSDLVKNGTYHEIIPNIPKNFFNNATQALQAVYDNTVLLDEVLKHNNRLHIPFVNSNGDKFVAHVFRLDGKLKVYVLKFLYTNIWNVSDGEVFVFPKYSIKK